MVIYISNLLITKYKGKYTLKVPYDEKANDFNRKLNGTYEDIDYILNVPISARSSIMAIVVRYNSIVRHFLEDVTLSEKSMRHISIQTMCQSHRMS